MKFKEGDKVIIVGCTAYAGSYSFIFCKNCSSSWCQYHRGYSIPGVKRKQLKATIIRKGWGEKDWSIVISKRRRSISVTEDQLRKDLFTEHRIKLKEKVSGEKKLSIKVQPMWQGTEEIL